MLRRLSIEEIKFFLLKFMFYIAPFIGAINYRLSPAIAFLVMILPIFLVSVLGLKQRQFETVSLKSIRYISVGLLAVSLVRIMYKIVKYDNPDFYYEQFFLTTIIFLFTFPIIIDFKKFLLKNILNYIKYCFYLLSFYTVYESIVFYIFSKPELQLMYKPELWSYQDKTFTLLGQPSVTATLLCFLFLINRYMVERSSVFMLICLVGVILILGTGTGFLCLLIVFLVFLYQNKLILYVSVPIISLISVAVFFSNVIYKVSLNYFTYLYDLFIEFISDYINQVTSTWDLLLGVNPKYDVPIDLGPLFFIGNIGMISFILYSLLLLYIILNVKNVNFKLSFIVLLIGNLHYPVMFYPLSHILIASIIYFSAVCNKKNTIINE